MRTVGGVSGHQSSGFGPGERVEVDVVELFRRRARLAVSGGGFWVRAGGGSRDCLQSGAQMRDDRTCHEFKVMQNWDPPAAFSLYFLFDDPV